MWALWSELGWFLGGRDMTWRLGGGGRGKERDPDPGHLPSQQGSVWTPASCQHRDNCLSLMTGNRVSYRQPVSVMPAQCASHPRMGPISVIGCCPVSVVSGPRDVLILAPANVPLVA